ncbi:MAG: hypothetical protein ACI8Y8_003390, partial [Planctomycetota bacterium]
MTEARNSTTEKDRRLATVYEGMFLLDNQVVREDWKAAKALVTATIEKHGGT